MDISFGVKSMKQDNDEELPPPFYDCESEYDMRKTQKQLIYEMHQAMFGVEGTEENGMVGRVCSIDNHLEKQNDSIAKNTTSCAVNRMSSRNIWKVLIVLVVVFGTGTGLGIAF